MRPISAAMVAAITDACRSSGALLIADEVQCGLAARAGALSQG